MLKPYDSSFARCPRKARFGLEENGVEYESIEIDMYSPERQNQDSWFRKVNPTGMLPVLEDDGRFIRESSVICEYADEAFEGPALMPADPYWRAVVRLLDQTSRGRNPLPPSSGDQLRGGHCPRSQEAGRRLG